MKRFSKLALVVLAVGILIQFAALLGEHATEIPFVLRIIAPSYCHAIAGAKILAERHGLQSNEEGYPEISNVLYNYLFDGEKFPARLRSNDIRIGRIFDSGNMVMSGSANGGQMYNRPFYFSIISTNIVFYGNTMAGSPTNYVCDLDRIKEPIERLKEPNILLFCFGMFIVGSILDVFAFFMESDQPKEPAAKVNKSSYKQEAQTADKREQK